MYEKRLILLLFFTLERGCRAFCVPFSGVSLDGTPATGSYEGAAYEAVLPPLPPRLDEGVMNAWNAFEKGWMSGTEMIGKKVLGNLPASPVPSLFDAIPEMYRDYLGQTYGGDRVLTCPKEKSYNIVHQKDLDKFIGELECIYQRGQVPLRPPIGPWYGNVHEVVNTNFVNLIANSFWTGKLGFKTQCRQDGTEFSMLMNIVLSGARAPAVMYIGKINEPLAPGEYYDGKPTLIIDYSMDFARICPTDSQYDYNMNWGIINNMWPVRSVVDAVRKVGQGPDGSHIMLGKSLFRDPQSWPERGDVTVGWWSVVSYDNSAFSSDFPGVLGPNEKDFVYRQPGVFETVARVLPFDNIPESPAQAFATMKQNIPRNFFGLPPLSPYGVAVSNHTPGTNSPHPITETQPQIQPTILPGGRVSY